MASSKQIVGSIISVAFSGLVIFLSAGRFDYWQGWIYTGLFLVSSLLNAFLSHPNGPLSEERTKRIKDGKTWDKIILSLYFIANLLVLAIASIDTGRLNLTGNIDFPIIAAGIVLFISGNLIFAFALKENNYFSSVVRIQKDRNHQVCKTGLYSKIRHPGYLGMILALIALPLIFESLWSVIPTAMAFLLIVTRTILEDKTLSQELDGYSEYKKEIKYMLIPHIV